MYRWYYPNLNIADAERLLLEKGTDGSYLVRPSKSTTGHLSLSVRRKDKITHIKIRHNGDSYDLYGGEQFADLGELIQYYTENQFKEKSGEVFKLKNPLCPTDPIRPTTERWFHGPISGIVAEKLIMEKGVNGSFLVRESQSKVGDYVLTVRTKDELSQADKVTHVIVRRHHNNKYDVGGGAQFATLTELVEHYKKNPMVDTTGTVVNMKYPFNATRVTASDIDARVKELSKEDTSGNNGFWEEFEHLQHQECKVLFDRKIGKDPKNVAKNRYKYILPYDYTRVILKKPHDDSDYINADYVKLVDDYTTICQRTQLVPFSKVYIATQGPLPSTIDDMWWMVWQEKSDTIVMITKEVEKDKNKCCQYWPLKQDIMRCGPLEIKMVAEIVRPMREDYVIREFEIKYLGDENSTTRRVFQYQYLTWPDRDTPCDPKVVLGFLRDINHRPPRGPMIVHCSAGIGRSGTLIVIDMLIDQLKNRGLTYEIDIQRIVKTVRAQRSGLVQTEAQYKFIYLAIQNYIATITNK